MLRIKPNGSAIGCDHPRVEGVEKVTGKASYGADHRLDGEIFAFLRTSTIARGRIISIDRRCAAAVPGVLALYTYEDVGDAIRPGKVVTEGGLMSHAIALLASDRIHFAGQIVGMAVATTFEAAREAADALDYEYAAQAPTASFDDPGARTIPAKSLLETSMSVGDVERAITTAAHVVEAIYETPAQHHNSLELYQTTCRWDGDMLTVWESSQNVRGYQHGLAEQLGVPAEQIRVRSEVVGGAFGARAELGPSTALVAWASRRLARPVKLVVSRAQAFSLRSYRGETRHHLRIGADRDGTLVALSHEARELTSRIGHVAMAGAVQTGRLYACPNVRTEVKNVLADRQTSGWMRCPSISPYLFALESGVDELAHALSIDPLDLRRRNDTAFETVTGKPYTSRSLQPCLDAAARAFGWERRSHRPGSMRDGDELIGWGMATAFYPAQSGPTDCRITLSHDLTAKVEVGTHEIGTGIRTIVAQTVADLLGLPIRAIDVELGDSTLPAAPMSSGSNSTASVCSALALCCVEIKERLALAAAGLGGAFEGADIAQARLVGGRIEAGERVAPLPDMIALLCGGEPLVHETTYVPPGMSAETDPPGVRRGRPVMLGGVDMADRVQFAFGCQMVEVRVDRRTGSIRVPRIVGAFAAGRIMNPRTAKSQLMGGQIWGVASALLEATEVDRRSARYTNDDLGDYLVAVNADLPAVETLFVDDEDRQVNPLGIKGLGELGLCGTNAAVANAVFHATGVRVRRTPIRMEDLVGRGALA